MTDESIDNGFLYKYGTGKQVIISKYKDKCFMANSFRYKKKDDNEFLDHPITSFIYFNGENKTVEWCPPYGPISINTKSDESVEYAREDFFLGYATNGWTQLAVDELNLNNAALYDIDYIFSVLSRYS